ncbi:hypothetical protein EJ04DRAFT_411037, partial [Polyplosphaeria fusca]
PTPSNPHQPTMPPTDELADLGRERYDRDTAAIGDRDFALHNPHGVAAARIRQGRAPAGFEQQVFAWKTLAYTTEDRDEKEEAKGDLHGGQLHRRNRAVAMEQAGGWENRGGAVAAGGGSLRGMRGGRGGRGGPVGGVPMRGMFGVGPGGAVGGSPRGGRGRGRGRGGGGGMGEQEEELVAGRKPDGYDVPPMAKGFAEELSKDMFWN